MVFAGISEKLKMLGSQQTQNRLAPFQDALVFARLFRFLALLTANATPGHGCVFGSSTGSPSVMAAAFRSASAETRISKGTCNRTSSAAASCTAS